MTRVLPKQLKSTLEVAQKQLLRVFGVASGLLDRGPVLWSAFTAKNASEVLCRWAGPDLSLCTSGDYQGIRN